MTSLDSEQGLFTADELRLAAENSSRPDLCRRAASWAIYTVTQVGTSPDDADPYFRAVAAQFI